MTSESWGDIERLYRQAIEEWSRGMKGRIAPPPRTDRTRTQDKMERTIASPQEEAQRDALTAYAAAVLGKQTTVRQTQNETAGTENTNRF